MTSDGAGAPAVVIVNEPAAPTTNTVLFALVIAADRFTASEADAVLPVPPLLEVTAPVVFV